MAIELLPGVCQLDTACPAPQEWRTKKGLHSLNLLGQGGLRHAQQLCRASIVEHFGEHDEVAYLSEVDAPEVELR